MCLRSFLVVCTLFTFALPSFCQFTQGMKFYGISQSDFFGSALDTVGDLNGDGCDDYIIGAENGGPAGGSAQVHSGIDGSILYFKSAPLVNTDFGFDVCGLGDLNGDDVPEFAVGAPQYRIGGVPAGAVLIYSGADGSLHSMLSGDSIGDDFGYSLDNAGDVNNDGIEDVVVGIRHDDFGASGTGTVRVFSGADLSVLYSFHGDFAGDQLGSSVSSAGDVNNDGFVDIIAGAPGSDVGGNAAGAARVFSGFDGSILFDFYGTANLQEFGLSVSDVDDLNQDGYSEFLICAPSEISGGFSVGAVHVYSGLDGQEIHAFYGDSGGDRFGWRARGTGDIDGDAVGDLIVGAIGDDNNGLASGSARVFSGADFSVLQTFNGVHGFSILGIDVAGAGDINGDGFEDVIIGADRDQIGGVGTGSATLYLANSKPVLKYKTKTRRRHFLDAIWVPDPAGTTSVTGAIVCSGGDPIGSGLAAMSLGRTDLIIFGFVPLLVSPDPSFGQQVFGFTFDGVGQVIASSITRRNPFLAGQQVYVQFFETSPRVLSSNGLRFDLIP